MKVKKLGNWRGKRKIMDKDIVYDECEISIAANQIENYAEFLGDCLQEYQNILTELKTKGIRDEKVCAQIDELIDTISPYKHHIYQEGKNLKNMANMAMREVENIDKYTFTFDIMSSIRSILSRFLF